MAKCPACGKFISPSGAAACTACSCIYHKECIGMSYNAVISKTWVCPECNKKKRKGDNSSTPVKSIEETVAHSLSSEAHVTGSPSSISIPLPSSAKHIAPQDGEKDVRDMRRELAEYMAELKEFRMELEAVITSMGDRLSGFERRLEVLEQREVVPIQSEVAVLQQAIGQLKQELNDRDQDMLLSDLDIGQLPEQKGENVSHTVSTLVAKLGVSLDDRDIVFAERVGALHARSPDSSGVARGPRRVVVRLTRRQLKDDILRAARVRRGLTSADLGIAGPPVRIYINERLTRNNRVLFNRAAECRARQWKYSWTRRGRVYVRQGDGKQAYPIRTDANFDRVFENGPV